MLVRELGPDAYSGSRLMRRKAKSADERKYWRDVAMAVGQIARKRIGLDTETRMAAVADFGDGREPGTWEHERRKVNPIDELKRLVGEQGAEPTPRWPRPASPALQTAKFRLTEQHGLSCPAPAWNPRPSNGQHR